MLMNYVEEIKKIDIGLREEKHYTEEKRDNYKQKNSSQIPFG